MTVSWGACPEAVKIGRQAVKKLRVSAPALTLAGSRRGSKPYIPAAAAVAILLLTACGDKPMPVVTTIDTLCTVTTRYHATDSQVAAFRADKALWEPLVDWLLGFNKERDKRCLQPAKGA